LSHHIGSSSFHNPEPHQNPERMPCECADFVQPKAYLGKYLLSQEQIACLNAYEALRQDPEMTQMIVERSGEVLDGYSPLNVGTDGYFRSRQAEKGGQVDQFSAPQIGDIRIKWEVVHCNPITIVAQQMENEENELTFRPFYPKSPNAKLGEEDYTEEAACPVQCICCWGVEKCFKAVFTETIDYCRFGTNTADQVFDKLEEENKSSTTLFRFGSWFLSVFGHYLLFSPIIALLNWIPLVGSLLAGIAALAAAIFSLVWATMLHFLVLAVAWIVYRPLFGILMLAGVGAALALMFLTGN